MVVGDFCRCREPRGLNVTVKQCCLIVDDSEAVRKVMRHTIEGLGYEAGEASNATDALARCKSKMPEVILLDWHLPGSSAFEFLGIVRSMPGGKLVKILYVATNNDPVEIGRAIAAGANDHMIKPFRRVTLEAKIAQFTAKAREAQYDEDVKLPQRRLLRSY